MNKIQKYFGKKVVLPVIHIKDSNQALRNAELAKNCEADGIWLIYHGYDKNEIYNVTNEVRKEFTDLWIGVNLLGLSLSEAFKSVEEHLTNINAIWTDNAEIDADQFIKPNDNYLYFGGVSFKYQEEVPIEKLASVSEKAASLIDVVTTSGPATGVAPNVKKLALMRKGLGDASLAVASGVAPQNVNDMLPYVDAFMVATGISKSFYNLDKNLTKELINIIKKG